MGALSRSGSARDAVEAAERAKGTSRFLAVLRHGLFHLQLSLAADGADGGGRARIAARTPGKMNGRAAGRSRSKKSQEDDAARRVEKIEGRANDRTCVQVLIARCEIGR